jgi:surface protein
MKESFVSCWQTIGSDNKITLPTNNGIDVNLLIDWGDGSDLENITGNVKATHTYKTAGIYTISIAGNLKSWVSSNVEGATLIEVKNLGDCEWENLWYSFANCFDLKKFNSGTCNTSNVSSISEMFIRCHNIKELTLNIDTSNVNDMSGTFSELYSLERLDLSSFNTANVLYMGHMFSEMHSLESLNIKSFNTEKVLCMTAMFSQLNLDYLDLSNFNTRNCKTMERMFQDSSFKNLNLSNFKTEKAQNFIEMFSRCSLERNLDLRGFKSNSAITIADMFNGFVAPKVNFSGFTISDDIKRKSFLYQCKSNITFNSKSLRFIKGFDGASESKPINTWLEALA